MTVPHNAIPSLTMAISYDFCMLTNLNEDAPEKGRRKNYFQDGSRYRLPA